MAICAHAVIMRGMANTKFLPPSADSQQWLTEAAVAHRLGYSTDTLRRMARRGEGPPRLRLSTRTVRYRAADVDRWAAERTGTTD
jgi:predicted DNA-binding transcriptional regulator AlpA